MEDICVGIVWINMLPEDSLEAALPSIKFLDDKRIQHFYDPSQKSGKQIATSVGWDDKIAWDIYLFYPPSVEFQFNFTIFVFHASHNSGGCLKIHLVFEYLQQSWNN